MNPVCELNDFDIKKLFIETLDYESSGDIAVSFAIDYDLAFHKDNQRIVRVHMRYILRPDPDDAKPRCPYAIQAEIEGLFSFADDADEKQVAYLCRVNSLTILYGVLRGIVANTTGSFKNGKFLLPTVMMQEVIRDRETRSNSSPNESASPATSHEP